MVLMNKLFYIFFIILICVSCDDSSKTHAIGFVGNSRIAQGDWTRITIPTVNEGIVGDSLKSRNTPHRLNHLCNRNYDYIIIELGGNDIRNGSSIQECLINLENICRTLELRTHTKVILHCILPVIYYEHANYENIKRYNSAIKRFANDWNYVYLDYYNDFLDPTTGLADLKYYSDVFGVHMSALGYEKWYSLLNRDLPYVVSREQKKRRK
jgi:lysophospholipase L1-like esterase